MPGAPCSSSGLAQKAARPAAQLLPLPLPNRRRKTAVPVVFPGAARTRPLTGSGPRSAAGFYLAAGPLIPAPPESLSNPDSTFRFCLHVSRSHFRSYPGSRSVEPNLKGLRRGGAAEELDPWRFPRLPGPVESGDHAYPRALHHLLRLLRPLARRGRHPLRPHLPPAMVSDHCSGAGRALRYGSRNVGCRAFGRCRPPEPRRAMALTEPHRRLPTWTAVGQGRLSAGGGS